MVIMDEMGLFRFSFPMVGCLWMPVSVLFLWCVAAVLLPLKLQKARALYCVVNGFFYPNGHYISNIIWVLFQPYSNHITKGKTRCDASSKKTYI